VAAAMIAGRSTEGERLNACELLDLTTAEVIELTGAHMPDVEPTGSGDLGLLCTYGGPGSPERYAALLNGTDPDGGVPDNGDPDATGGADGAGGDAAGDDGAGDDGAGGDGAGDLPLTETTTTPLEDPAFDTDRVPDTFAAGVVEPIGGAYHALAGQAAMLGVRYACSDVRGPAASAVVGAAPGAPEAPAEVLPQLPTAYIDCVAAPAGGGVEVHTILVSGSELWHVTLLRPETPRSPANESEALAGLHRAAWQILA